MMAEGTSDEDLSKQLKNLEEEREKLPEEGRPLVGSVLTADLIRVMTEDDFEYWIDQMNEESLHLSMEILMGYPDRLKISLLESCIAKYKQEVQNAEEKKRQEEERAAAEKKAAEDAQKKPAASAAPAPKKGTSSAKNKAADGQDTGCSCTVS